MRFIYSCFALAVLLACENATTHPHLDTSTDTESEAPASTTDSAEPVTPTSTSATEGVEPHSTEDSTTGDTSTTVFPGTGTVDPDEPAESSTTLFESDTDDTASASDTDEPPEETSTGSDPQSCVGAASPVKAEVLAYLESQIEGDTGGEPGRLYLRFSSQSFTCADPHAELACGHNWDVSLQIPGEFQAPGVYALADGPIGAIARSNDGGDVCQEAEGAVSGTLEIDAIDDASVTGRLCNLRAYGIEGQIVLDGTFVAPRCAQ
ncbi:hypothetical protein [Nannocystis bainbridge]|uniref:Lipoprotein n=1 Tax=Nannocystis bainbridge TaxID=2995303 RepID=A0ABT5DSR1_9BACT|nr:hypothetical protein [Nannocystis bainbridge]MDC0716655.1 hypothetical protein [Nannocystis bainbridge]